MCKGASAAAVEAASDGGGDEERAAPKRRACCRTFLKVDGLPRPPRTVKHCQGAFCSLALGTAGLGALWAMFLRLLAPRPWARGALAAQTICSVAGLAPLVTFASKGFLHPKFLRVELDALGAALRRLAEEAQGLLLVVLREAPQLAARQLPRLRRVARLAEDELPVRAAGEDHGCPPN